jgi:hypothetical protein
MSTEPKSPEEILRQSEYTPHELADLLEMSLYVIQSAVWNGQLKATVIGHDIMSMRREDVLQWLDSRR